MTSSKAVFLLLLCAAVVLAVVAPKPSRPATPDAVVVTVSFWGSYEEWLMWREIKAAFERDNPDIWIKLDFIPGLYDDKIRLLLAADSAPDVMQLQDEPFPAYCEYGKFEDLAPYAETPGCSVDFDDYFPTSVESFHYKGNQYAMPLWGGENMIYFNRDIFDKEGAPYPEPEWTFDEFVGTCRRLTRDFDGDGRIDQFGFFLPYWLYWLPWTWSMGANILNEERTDWAFNTPEALASLQLYHDMRFKHQVVPKTTQFSDMDEAVMFMTGKVAMFCSGPWASPPLRQSSINYGVAHMPIGPAGRFTRVSWDGLVMFRLSEHKPEAWRFIQFAASREAQDIVASYTRSIPALKSARDAFVEAGSAAGMELFYDAMEYVRLQPISIQWFKMDTELRREYDKLGLGAQTPEQTLANLDKAMEKVFPVID